MKLQFLKIAENSFPDLLDMMASFYAIDHYSFDRVKTEKNLSAFISDKTLGRAWIISCNEVTCGYLMLTFGFSFEYNGKIGLIDEFYLKPEFRRMGIGKKTMDFIDAQAIELDIKTVHLEVEKHNKGGTKLYKSKGYYYNGRILLSKGITPKTNPTS